MEKQYKYQDLTHDILVLLWKTSAFRQWVSGGGYQRALAIELGLRNIYFDAKRNAIELQRL